MATEIRIPRSKKDLRIKHLKALQECVISESPTLTDKVIFLTDLTGTPLYELRKLKPKAIDKLYAVAVMSFAGFKINDEPPQEIELDGNMFELINPHKVASGWHIDFSSIDIEKDPVRAACLFYYPKGHSYGETDENNNLINPIADRYETIKEHLPLQAYLEASAFFLKKSERSMNLQLVRLKAQRTGRKINQRLKSLLGRKQSTN
tara:strand:+ start:931 stop:1548 length:618 start_codon:yes stop_codon:yes gene_type:complete